MLELWVWAVIFILIQTVSITISRTFSSETIMVHARKIMRRVSTCSRFTGIKCPVQGYTTYLVPSKSFTRSYCIYFHWYLKLTANLLDSEWIIPSTSQVMVIFFDNLLIFPHKAFFLVFRPSTKYFLWPGAPIVFCILLY